jgi:hypothetical protein
MKGGVVRKSVNIREPNGNYFHDDRHACHYFLNNCTMQILSNSTISAITFRCTLKPDFESPFIHVRYGIFNKPVRQLFIKCLPTWDPTEASNREGIMRRVNNGRSGGPPGGWGQIGQIEINTIATVQREAQMQHDIYRSTFYTANHYFDPVCPSIISMKYIPKNRQGLPANQHTVEKMLDYIRARLDPREGNGRDGRRATLHGEMAEIRDTFFMNDPNIGITIIIMEMMDGYIPVPTYTGNNVDSRNTYISRALAKYEFKRLARAGFRHGDIHEGNYMINPSYNYITDNTGRPLYPGRVIIIDFGRSTRLTSQSAVNDEIRSLDQNVGLLYNHMPGTITMFTYDEIVQLLSVKKQLITNYLNSHNINSQNYIDSLNARRIVGGATDISNENENDNEIIKQFLNNQPIDIIKQLLEMHKERILKVGDLIDKFNESNIKKQLTPSNDENMLTKKMNQNSIQNKTTKKQQSPLRNTIFNNFNHNSTRLMVAGKKAKPFSRTRKNKRT